MEAAVRTGASELAAAALRLLVSELPHSRTGVCVMLVLTLAAVGIRTRTISVTGLVAVVCVLLMAQA